MPCGNVHHVHVTCRPRCWNCGEGEGWSLFWESPRAKKNLTLVGFEPITSRLDLPMLYQPSYEASTGAGQGNLGSESRLIFK